MLRSSQYNSKWLNDPQFVNSFEAGEFVYFVFRETAVEYINCGKVKFTSVAFINWFIVLHIWFVVRFNR